MGVRGAIGAEGGTGIREFFRNLHSPGRRSEKLRRSGVLIDFYSVFEILPRAVEIEVGKNKRHGGDYYCDNVTLSFEEIGEHGDEEQYAQQDGEKALLFASARPIRPASTWKAQPP